MTGETAAQSEEPSRIAGLYELAMRRHQAGELRAAEELYRAILVADPRQLDCLNFLGMIALQEDRPKNAAELLGQAIAANDGIAAYHVNIAQAYRALGEPGKAIDHLRKAVSLQADDWAAHARLADLLREAGELSRAAEHYRKAIALKPDLRSAQHNLAAVLLDLGQPNDALDAASRALAARDDAETRTLFLQCVRNADRLPAFTEFRGQLIRALRETWTRPAELTGAAIAVITAEPTIARGIHAATMSWPRRLSPQEIGPAMGVMAADELLQAVLNTTVVNDPGLERLLTSARTIMLDAAAHANSEVSPEMVGLACAIARQCFINEYVFDVSDAERQGVAWLRTSARAALAGRAPVFALHLIALAAYAPLHTLERDDALFNRRWLKPLEALIGEQVREPQAEAALRASMPRLTEIADPVSVEVREQYEQNPYPRWVSLPVTAPAAGLVAHVRDLFPNAPLRDIAEPEVPDILVAGCGTGQQPIGTAQRFPKARVLAVDLSLASLAYAKRKSQALHVPIEYAQADILELAPDRRFDLIESTGVLHHLADPMRGWAALVRLLKPGGLMRIGLYSELGRRDVVALRARIAERGYRPTPDDIRRCRQEIMSAQDRSLSGIVYSPDFSSLSACRDLLFHVQEHRFTLPQIAEFLSEHGLTFLGFELGARAYLAYRRTFPQDAAMTDLDSWHRFETSNPATFGSMYQFWVQGSV